ncbi:MAG: hypothetical protein UH625_04985 [Muribaculaceae bacterium]|nr:hypothetical protein [Muribaculaceae bacterium]
METPLITWTCVVALFVMIIVINIIRNIRFHRKGNHRIFEIGSERDEFFVPGDPANGNSIDYDYED